METSSPFGHVVVARPLRSGDYRRQCNKSSKPAGIRTFSRFEDIAMIGRVVWVLTRRQATPRGLERLPVDRLPGLQHGREEPYPILDPRQSAGLRAVPASERKTANGKRDRSDIGNRGKQTWVVTSRWPPRPAARCPADPASGTPIPGRDAWQSVSAIPSRHRPPALDAAA